MNSDTSPDTVPVSVPVTSPVTSPVLEIKGLKIKLPKGSDRPFALENLDLTVRPSEVVCLVGESGSGKSLCASAIMRLLPEPDVHVHSGTIMFDDEQILTKSETEMKAMRGNRIAMIFQEPMTALNPQKSVGWQIDEVLKLHSKLSRTKRYARTIDMLERVQLPDPASAYNAYPHQISGGQRQRVMIAMALSLSPRLIIADEPTTALDVTTQLQILKLIRDLQDEENAGVLFITHDFGVVAEIADQVVVLKDGIVVESGPADSVLNKPQHEYTQALIGSVPALNPPAARANLSAPVILEGTKLNKTFDASGGFLTGRRNAVVAVKDFSFKLHEGETLGVLGESGSGKTTVSRLVTRLLEATSGAVEINGQDLLACTARELRSMRRYIQMVFQDPMASLNPRKRIVDIIAQGPIVHGEKPATARKRAEELLELVELSPSAANRFPHEFSGGQRQRIGIARALALEPKIIVADELVSALDVSVQAQVLRLLSELRDRMNLSLIFVTHDLRVAAQLCDRVIIMQRGEIVEAGATAEVFAAPRHPYTQNLLASIPGRNWTPPAMPDKSASSVNVQ